MTPFTCYQAISFWQPPAGVALESVRPAGPVAVVIAVRACCARLSVSIDPRTVIAPEQLWGLLDRMARITIVDRDGRHARLGPCGGRLATALDAAYGEFEAGLALMPKRGMSC